jgi:hypothetical protein
MTLGDIIYTVLTPQLLLLYFMSCWLLVLLCPRQWYPWLVAILFPVWCAIWWLMTRPVPSSDDWSFLGRGFMALGLLATLVAAGLRALIATFAKRRREPIGKLDWVPARASILATVLGAVVLEIGPVLAHRVGALATLVLLVVTLAGSGALALYPKVRKIDRRRAGTVAFMLFVSLFLIAIWPFSVSEGARNFAKGRPYCILVADGEKSERLANSRWDLSPLIMRASDGHRTGINRHAYIVLGEGRSAHWSYMRGEFVNDPSPFHSTDQLDPDTRCAPVAGFVERLPWF